MTTEVNRGARERMDAVNAPMVVDKRKDLQASMPSFSSSRSRLHTSLHISPKGGYTVYNFKNGSFCVFLSYLLEIISMVL